MLKNNHLRISTLQKSASPATTIFAPSSSAAKKEDVFLSQIKTATSLSCDHGFKFGIENNDPEAFMFAHPDRCAELLNQIPDLGFVWDLNHTAPQHAPTFQALANRMSMLHVSDTPLPETNHQPPFGPGQHRLPILFPAPTSQWFQRSRHLRNRRPAQIGRLRPRYRRSFNHFS